MTLMKFPKIFQKFRTKMEDDTKQGWKSPDHYWAICSMCGPMVICGKCGNNCCNAGYGGLPDGSICDACPSAYDKQDSEWSEEEYSEWLKERNYHSKITRKT